MVITPLRKRRIAQRIQSEDIEKHTHTLILQLRELIVLGDINKKQIYIFYYRNTCTNYLYLKINYIRRVLGE